MNFWNQPFVKKTVTVSIFLTLSVGIFLRINNLNNVNYRTPDEVTYTYQATEIARFGTGAVKILVSEYNNDNRSWFYPSPIRIGYIGLVAVIMKMTHTLGDERAGAYVACFFSIIGLLILIAAGLKFLNPYITLFGLIFLSVSPMDLAIARRAWQDAMLGCLAALLIYLSCAITSSRRKIILYALFVFTGSYCILIKESGTIIYTICLLWVLWMLSVKKRLFPEGVFLTTASILGGCLSITVLAYIGGGFPVIIEALKHHLGSIPNNQYALIYQSGPWYNLPLGLWIVDPVNTILCLIGTITALFNGVSNLKNLDEQDYEKRFAVPGIAFFMIAFLAITMLAPHCQNLRYLSVLYVPFYLMAGLGLWRFILFCKNRKNTLLFMIIAAAVFGIIITTAIGNYLIFKNLFVDVGLNDLSVNLLKKYALIVR